MVCTGGTPTPLGAQIPLVDFTVELPTNITSRAFADGTSEALLLIDEPYPAGETPIMSGTSSPQAFCVASGGSNCSLTGVGDSGSAYQGTKNVFQGMVATDPATGRSVIAFYGSRSIRRWGQIIFASFASRTSVET